MRGDAGVARSSTEPVEQTPATAPVIPRSADAAPSRVTGPGTHPASASPRSTRSRNSATSSLTTALAAPDPAAIS